MSKSNKYEKFDDGDTNQGYCNMRPDAVLPSSPAVHFSTFPGNSVSLKWSWCNLVASVMSLFWFPVFGIIALTISILAYVDHKANDYQRSQFKRKVAWGFALAAFVTGCLIMAAFLVLTYKGVIQWKPFIDCFLHPPRRHDAKGMMGDLMDMEQGFLTGILKSNEMDD